jgi:hypothetical protein
MFSTTMPSEIIKAEVTSCCFRGLPWGIAPGAYNVARGWVGSYAITIGRRHEWVGLLRPIF